MDEDDDAELGVLLGSLSENAARIASEALAGASATAPPARPSIGGDLDWLVRAIADALRRRRLPGANRETSIWPGPSMIALGPGNWSGNITTSFQIWI